VSSTQEKLEQVHREISAGLFSVVGHALIKNSLRGRDALKYAATLRKMAKELEDLVEGRRR